KFFTIKLGGAQVADYYVRSFKVAGGVSLTIEGMANLQSVEQIREELKNDAVSIFVCSCFRVMAGSIFQNLFYRS
ncbi:hypothetical protein, partial [Pseudomonas sp.]|uniref:hypothetical protein n=1 Tax=Pseudomonas sp. TaxID=306 RepID=UPI002FC9892C